jgi:hypothetical protein
MIQKNDRVKFIDKTKEEKYGVLLVFEVKGEYAFIGKGDFKSLGQNLMTVKLNELKKAE